MDPNTAGTNLILLDENKMVQYVREEQPHPPHPDRFDILQVLCNEGLTGRHYWEVECHFGEDIGVAYKSIARTGDCSQELTLGENEKSWCLSMVMGGSFKHNGSSVPFWSDIVRSSTIGVYLDWPAGILSFFEVSSDTLTHLYTAHTTFTEPVHPAFCVETDGSMSLRKLQ